MDEILLNIGNHGSGHSAEGMLKHDFNIYMNLNWDRNVRTQRDIYKSSK